MVAVVALERYENQMKQDHAWEIVASSLRLHFLQGNSHIEGIDSWIEERVVETLDKIRQTAESRGTARMIEKATERISDKLSPDDTPIEWGVLLGCSSNRM